MLLSYLLNISLVIILTSNTFAKNIGAKNAKPESATGKKTMKNGRDKIETRGDRMETGGDRMETGGDGFKIGENLMRVGSKAMTKGGDPVKTRINLMSDRMKTGGDSVRAGRNPKKIGTQHVKTAGHLKEGKGDQIKTRKDSIRAGENPIKIRRDTKTEGHQVKTRRNLAKTGGNLIKVARDRTKTGKAPAKAEEETKDPELTPEQEMEEMFKNDVSASTYFAVKNISTDYKFNFNATETLAKKMIRANRSAQFQSKDGLLRKSRRDNDVKRPTDTRRQLLWARYDTYFDYDKNFYVYGCMLVTNSYTVAFIDFRRYFPMRIIYQANLEYEVGYLVYNIVHKYQSIVEVFHLVHVRYAMANQTDLAPVQYMFYLYRVISEGCKVIIHLCNMMHELKRKYKGHETIFTVLTEYDKQKRKRKQKEKKGSSFKDRAKLAAEARRERRKDLARGLLRLTKPTKPRRGVFPLEYGWSIEDWWIKETINSSMLYY